MKTLIKNVCWLGLILTECVVSLATILFVTQVVVIPVVATSGRTDHDTIQQNEKPFAFATRDPFWQPLVDPSGRGKDAAMRARRELQRRRL